MCPLRNKVAGCVRTRVAGRGKGCVGTRLAGGGGRDVSEPRLPKRGEASELGLLGEGGVSEPALLGGGGEGGSEPGLAEEEGVCPSCAADMHSDLQDKRTTRRDTVVVVGGVRETRVHRRSHPSIVR